ncbi:MAG TPA: hypothetical protein VNU97_18745 [Rhizomicrobium sp.]|jgi:hypothetical protein|nr:hypothetical protein [Rhizomicrobium sp.]
MRMLAAAVLALLALSRVPALADAPPSKYMVTPLTQADVDFYLAIKRPGADCVTHATGADKEALDIMRKNHGVLAIAAMPQIKGNPTPAQLAQLQADMGKISAQAEYNGKIETRVAALSMCDETIAQKRGVKAHYLEIKEAVEEAVPMQGDIGGSCGGDDCGPANPTAAQKALWKKEEDVARANRALLKPQADEIRKLQKTMISAMGQ